MWFKNSYFPSPLQPEICAYFCFQSVGMGRHTGEQQICTSKLVKITHLPVHGVSTLRLKLSMRLESNTCIGTYCDMMHESRQRFAKHIPVIAQNRLLLDNGLVNTHSHGNRYANYNRQTVRLGVFYAGHLAVIKANGFMNSKE
jgi:hypothetical protein